MAERLTRDMLEATDQALPKHGKWYRRFHDPFFWLVFCVMEGIFQVVYWKLGIFHWWHH